MIKLEALLWLVLLINYMTAPVLFARRFGPFSAMVWYIAPVLALITYKEWW